MQLTKIYLAYCRYLQSLVSLKDLSDRFRRFLQNAGYGIAICELNKEIMGLVAWSKSYMFVSDCVRFRIEGLVVDKRNRGKGIGKSLMEFVENIASQESPAIIDLTSGLRRNKEGIHEFYQSIGYTNEGHMAKIYLRKKV